MAAVRFPPSNHHGIKRMSARAAVCRSGRRRWCPSRLALSAGILVDRFFASCRLAASYHRFPGVAAGLAHRAQPPARQMARPCSTSWPASRQAGPRRITTGHRHHVSADDLSRIAERESQPARFARRPRLRAELSGPGRAGPLRSFPTQATTRFRAARQRAPPGSSPAGPGMTPTASCRSRLIGPGRRRHRRR